MRPAFHGSVCPLHFSNAVEPISNTSPDNAALVCRRLWGCRSSQQATCWWDSLVVMGPKYGYHPNGHKTKLLVKPGLQQQAEEIFGGTGITVVTDGATYLGSPIGTPEYVAIQAAGC